MYRTKDQVASEFIATGKRRNITPRGIVICIATGLVESNLTVYANASVPGSIELPHDAVGSDSKSVGPLQQQVVMGNGWWWGPVEVCQDPTGSAGLFYDRLAKKNYAAATTDAAAGAIAQSIQGSAFPDRYATRMAEAQAIYDRLSDQPPVEENTVGFTGDPVWLEDVLREALGDRLVVEGDWADRGTGGTMGDIWGVLIHHTGNDRETVAGIRDGRSDLSGPLSQCLITPDGKCHLIAVGPCNHAGIGSYPGIGANNGNQRLIGFECAWPTIRPDGSYDSGQKWPDAQVITMRDATAAVLKKLGTDSSHVIGHKEWATKPPNVKWDPGNMDMNWFRGEVGKDLAGKFDGKPPVVTPPVVTPPPAKTDRELLQGIWDQLRIAWPQLGNRTLVDAVAELLKDKA